MLAGLLRLANASAKRAEAKVAVGDEWAHAEHLSEGQRPSVVGCAAFGIEPAGIGSDVAEKVQRMGLKAGLALSGFNRAIAQAPRIIEPAEQQTGTTQRVVGPATMGNDPPRHLTLEQRLALLDQLQCPARVADLRQRPGGGGDRPGKLDVPAL